MEARNFRIRSLSWMSSILLLVVLVLLNAVLARAGSRIDLTEEGIYSLSDGSRAILGKLEDPVSIKVYWYDVPLRFDNSKRYVAALLEEMEDASNGLVKSRWVDMSEDAGKEEASELGVEPYVFSATHGKEVRQAKGYMSLVIEMGDERPRNLDALFLIQDQLEYLIVSTIYQRSRVAPPIVGFVSERPFNPFGGGGQGEFTEFEALLTRAFGASARTYLSLDTPVADDVDVLIVARPRKFKPTQAYNFEQFLLRGGRGIVLLDPVDVENVLGGRGMGGESHESGLEDWLGHLGITAERGTVADFGAMCRFPRSQTELVLYPYWPMVLPENMDDKNPVTRTMADMPLYWPAALSIDEKRQEAEGRKVTILASTTEKGYRRGDITGLAQADERPEGKLLEKVPLIVMIEGPMTSFWIGKPIPGTEPEAGSGDGAEPFGDEAAPKDAETPKRDDEAAPKDDETPKKDGAGAGSPDGEPAGDAPPAEDVPKGDAPKDAPPKKDEPKKAGDGDEEADAKEEDGAAGPARLEKGDVHLMVLTDADMISTVLMRAGITRFNGNVGPMFVVSAAEWLSGSDDLLALRARAMKPRNLDAFSGLSNDEAENKQSLIKHLNWSVVPLLVLLAGMTIFFVRRSS